MAELDVSRSVWMELGSSIPLCQWFAAFVVLRFVLSSADRMQDVLALTDGRFNHPSGNPELEKAYLSYEAELLDERFGGQPNYFSLADFDRSSCRDLGLEPSLPERLRTMASMVGQSVGLPDDVLKARMDRIRLRFIDQHNAPFTRRAVGGGFSDGLASVSLNRPGDCVDLAILHEVAHGLEAVVTLLRLGDHVSLKDAGLAASFPRPGVRLRSQIFDLMTLQEAIVDRSALFFSVMDADEYLAGKYEEKRFGYAREGRALSKILETSVAERLIRANFVTGIQSMAEADEYVAALRDAGPALLEVSAATDLRTYR